MTRSLPKHLSRVGMLLHYWAGSVVRKFAKLTLGQDAVGQYEPAQRGHYKDQCCFLHLFAACSLSRPRPAPTRSLVRLAVR